MRPKPSLLAVKVFRVLIGIMISTIVIATSVAAQTVQTNLCELIKSPASFDGKLVRLRATVVSGFEVFGIRDPEDKCGLIWLEFAGGGPAASTSFGPAEPNIQRPQLKLKNNRQLKQFQRLLNAKMYPRSRQDLCDECSRYDVTAEMTGRLDYSGANHGFGHLNAFQTRLVLESVSDVSATDMSSHYDLTRFSPTPVHLPTGYLKGRVLAPDGRPIADAEVKVHSTADVPPYLQGFTEWTDEKGRFKVAVPPGTYLLGVNLEAPPSPAVPFPATYYPSALHEPAAKSVSVADRQKIGGLTIRIPERLRERKIPVRVTWPDGRPVADANVWLAEVGNPSAVVGWAVSHTTAEGTFVLTGFEGIDYFVHGSIYVKPSYKPYCADAITVRSGGEISDAILLVLSREGDVCRGW